MEGKERKVGLLGWGQTALDGVTLGCGSLTLDVDGSLKHSDPFLTRL